MIAWAKEIDDVVADWMLPAKAETIQPMVSARTQWLEAQGYTVIRFWTNEVMNDLDAVCGAILAASRGEWRSGPPPETG